MMTLHERVYSCLAERGEPMTAQAMAALPEFQDVPAMEVAKALLKITAQHAASFRVTNGKMYFSTEEDWGRWETGAQENMSQLSRLSGAMSSLMGGNRADASAALGLGSSGFPETAGDYPAYFNKVEFDPKRWNAKDFSLCFPKGAKVTKDPDTKHPFMTECYVNDDEEGFTLWASINPIDGDAPSREASLAQAKMMADHFCNMVNGNFEDSEVYRGEYADAAISYAVPNTFVILAMPQGLLTLRIDWNLGDCPPIGLVRKMITDWVDTYRYTGKVKYFVPRKLNQVPRAELLSEVEKSLNSQNRIVNAAKVSCSNNKSKKPFVKKLLGCRRQLQRAAAGLDEFVVEYMALLRQYLKTEKDQELLNGLYNGGLQLFNICSDIFVEMEIPGGAMGAYNSATDVVFGANVKNKTITVDIYPAHAAELLKLVTVDRLEDQRVPASEVEGVRRFYREQMSAIENAQKGETFYSDFKMEGDLLAAYLGNDADVTIPAGVLAIGDFAFKDCPELETVTLSDSVERLGFAVFDGCPKLKTVTMSPELTHIAGPLRGVTGMINFGKRKKKDGFKLRVYADTYAEKYAKENDIEFEIIHEAPKEPVVVLTDAQMDAFRKLMLPLPRGFLSSNQKPGSLTGEMAHIKYAAVPGDTAGGLSGYKDARFSVTATMDTMDVPNALQIAPEAEQRLNGVEHVHAQFRTCTAENGKIIIRYDMVKEGNVDGVRWGQYLVLMFHGNCLDHVQIFINGDYTHRQQEKAVREWAEKIRFASSVKKEQEEKARKEAAAKAEKEAADAAAVYAQQKKEYDIAYAQWQKDKSQVGKQRSAALTEKMAGVRSQRKQEMDASVARAIGYAKERLDYANTRKAAAEAELAKLGFFRFAEKKVKQAFIRAMAEKAAAAESEISRLQKTREENQKKLDAEMAALEKQLRSELEVMYPMPLEPQKPVEPKRAVPSRPERPSYNTSGMSAFGIANESIKDAIVETLEELGTLATITDILTNCPAAADLTNQRCSALVRQLVSEGRIERVERERKAYFRAI